MEGKVPVVMEIFTIERTVGDIALEIFFNTVVGRHRVEITVRIR